MTVFYVIKKISGFGDWYAHAEQEQSRKTRKIFWAYSGLRHVPQLFPTLDDAQEVKFGYEKYGIGKANIIAVEI